jgi:hypothetical protein
MKPTGLTFCLLLLVPAGAAAQPQPVSAEPWFGRTLMLTAELGGGAFSDFQRALAQPAADADDIGLSDFRRRVSASTTATVGAAVTWWVADGWGVRAATSYAPTRFSVWNEEHAQRALDEISSAQPAYAKLHAWTMSGTAMFRFPFNLGRLVPYGSAGAGVLRYYLADDAQLPPEARSAFAEGEQSAAAAVFGVGSAIPMQRNNMLLNFELTAHISRTPLADPAPGERFTISGVPLQLAPDPTPSGEDIGLTSHLRLTAGITLPARLGRR